jgi:hypothetical protein
LETDPTSSNNSSDGICGVDDFFQYILFTLIAVTSKVSYILLNLKNIMHSSITEAVTYEEFEAANTWDKYYDGDMWELSEVEETY